MTNPLISIVIPTCDRPETLVHCLRAMRHHKSDALEIVVTDNSRDGSAKSVVDQAAVYDPRIRYLAFPHSTCQRHSFELGLAAAHGQYLALLGDDDGYVMGSLDWLADRLKRTPVDAVRWSVLKYIWPTLSKDGVGFFDFNPQQHSGGSATLSAAPLAASNIAGTSWGSWTNILVYHGMIARSVYERMKAKTGGVFFRYPMADVYAHNLLPFFCDTYLQVNESVSIYGMSGRSAGASWTSGTSGDVTAAEARRWMSESVADEAVRAWPWHPEIRTMRYHDFAVFKLAEQHDMLGGLKPDHGVWKKEIFREIEMAPWQIDGWLRSEPQAEFDDEIFAAVRHRFGNRAIPVVANESYLKAANPRLPSLRIHAFDPTFPDTVEGAMLAMDKLVGSAADRFEAAAKPPPSRLSRVARRSLKQAIGLAPGLTTRLIRSRFMPGFLWRFAHRVYSGGQAGDNSLRRTIVQMNTRAVRQSGDQAQAKADPVVIDLAERG